MPLTFTDFAVAAVGRWWVFSFSRACYLLASAFQYASSIAPPLRPEFTDTP
jgi:hypothetical protein